LGNWHTPRTTARGAQPIAIFGVKLRKSSIWLPLVVVSLSPAQNHIDSRDDKIDLTTRDFAHPLCKLLLIERDDKRNVCDGVLWKTRHSGA
jgi:hypothetical protein